MYHFWRFDKAYPNLGASPIHSITDLSALCDVTQCEVKIDGGVIGLRFDAHRVTPKQVSDWAEAQKLPGKLETSIADHEPVKVDGERIYTSGARVSMRDSVEPTGVEQRRYDAPAELAAPESYGPGFLRLQGLTTRSGVFEYQRADGSKIRELRPPEEVLSPESLKTFDGLPVTIEHPAGLVDLTNARNLMHGVTMNPRPAGDHVKADVQLYTKEAIDTARAGKRQLSYGYDALVFDSPGIWTGPDGKKEPFDTVQRNIRGNHLAIVDRARAGNRAALRLDGATQIGQGYPPVGDDANKGSPDVKILIDGKEHEVTQEIADAIGAQRKKDLEAQTKALVDSKKVSDEAQAKLDAMEAQAKKVSDEASKADQASTLDKLIAERLEVATLAAPILGKTAAELVKVDSKSVIRETVKKANPELKLDGKSDDYVRAYFDQVTKLDSATAARNAAHAALHSDSGGTQTPVVDIEAARQRMLDRAEGKEATK